MWKRLRYWMRMNQEQSGPLVVGLSFGLLALAAVVIAGFLKS